eukprot:73534_1
MANVDQLNLEQEPLVVDSDSKQDELIETNGVRDWLRTIVQLPQYESNFVTNGYTTLHIIKGIENQEDLIDIGILLKGHRVKLMAEIRKINIRVQNDDDSVINRVLNDWTEEDDPLCLYICAVASLIIPLVGLIAMCCYSCGTNINGTRKRKAFVLLVICTITGIIIDILISFLFDDKNVRVSLV